MGSKVARVDDKIKQEIREMQEEHQEKTGIWIGEAKALNKIMGRDNK